MPPPHCLVRPARSTCNEIEDDWLDVNFHRASSLALRQPGSLRLQFEDQPELIPVLLSHFTRFSIHSQLPPSSILDGTLNYDKYRTSSTFRPSDWIRLSKYLQTTRYLTIFLI